MILTLVTMLVVVGLVAVYSASFALGQLEFGSPYFFVARQAMWAVVGTGLLVLLMRSDYHRLRAISPLLMLVALAGLAAVLAPDLGVTRNGAARWIALGPLPPVQPSEFAKLALIIYVSAWLSGKSRNLRSFAAGLAPFVIMIGLVAGLVMLEPDMGTTIIIVLTTITLFFVAGGALSHLLALMSIGGVTAAFLVLTGGYRTDRIFAFVSPESDPAGKGFHILQLLIALGSGGVTGLGVGASRQKFFYVPGAHTDGIFAIIGEEMGFIGALAVLLLFALLVYRGIRVMLNAPDNFGALLALGVTSWIAYQTIINIGGITRSMPLTGIPLPFLSYGGSALAATMAGIGILLSVSRCAKSQAAVRQARPVAKSAKRRLKEEGA
jgi:cell division protein FtsW